MVVDKLLQLAEGAVVSRNVDGETIVLAVDSSEYLGTNESGTILWEALARGTTHTELVELLVAAYRVSVEQADADVRTFVDACRDQGFLVR